jgi:NDP-sugar pyrophosphorylase family protein
MTKDRNRNPGARGVAIRAFILCGGAGTRLRPVLDDRPKSMAPVMSVPFLHLLVEQLRSQGIKDVILGTGHMAESIEDYFGTGERFAMSIRYSREQEPSGTGGSLKLAEPFLSDPILVLNGDTYADWNLVSMREQFTARSAQMVMALQSVSDVSRYGSVTLDRDGRITGFVEKGTCSGPGLINAGVYLLRKQIVHHLAEGTAISLERDVFPTLLNRAVYGSVCTGTFIDIGIPEDYHRAQTLLAAQARAASGEPA